MFLCHSLMWARHVCSQPNHTRCLYFSWEWEYHTKHKRRLEKLGRNSGRVPCTYNHFIRLFGRRPPHILHNLYKCRTHNSIITTPHLMMLGYILTYPTTHGTREHVFKFTSKGTIFQSLYYLALHKRLKSAIFIFKNWQWVLGTIIWERKLQDSYSS